MESREFGGTPVNASAAIRAWVFRLLAAQRGAVTYAGGALPFVQQRLAALRRHVLMEIVVPGASPTFLLFQRGRPVHIEPMHAEPAYTEPVPTMQPAAHGADLFAGLQARAAGGTLRLYALGDAAAALAMAVVGGGVTARLGVGARAAVSADERLNLLARQRFSGVLALGTDRVTVWHFAAGRVCASGELELTPPPGASGPVPTLPAHAGGPLAGFEELQVEWAECELPRLAAAVNQTEAVNQTDTGDRVDAEHRAAVRGAAAYDDGATWNEFRRVLQSHLGEASGGLYSLMQDEHGMKGGPELREVLGRQIERVAGRQAARHFQR